MLKLITLSSKTHRIYSRGRYAINCNFTYFLQILCHFLIKWNLTLLLKRCSEWYIIIMVHHYFAMVWIDISTYKYSSKFQRVPHKFMVAQCFVLCNVPNFDVASIKDRHYWNLHIIIYICKFQCTICYIHIWLYVLLSTAPLRRLRAVGSLLVVIHSQTNNEPTAQEFHYHSVSNCNPCRNVCNK